MIGLPTADDYLKAKIQKPSKINKTTINKNGDELKTKVELPSFSKKPETGN